jgi:flagellar hook-length control protein FliK
MNISQANHPHQKNATTDSQQITPEIADSEVFLNQLNLAQQGTEWYMETGLKTEKERIDEEQQVKRKQTADLENDQIVGLTNQAHIEQLKQSDTLESARVVSEGEAQARNLHHVEKKHLHTPAVTEEGENVKTENPFSKIMTGEMEGNRKGTSLKEPVNPAVNLERDEAKAAGRMSVVKSGETGSPETAQKFDASMIRGMNVPASEKSGVRQLDKGLSDLSKLTASDAATGKNPGKKTAAKITSFSNITSDTSFSNRKAESGLTAESSSGKTSEPVNIKDVVGTVKIMISSKTDEMVMRLAPEHLGKLEIKLRKEGDKILGRFKVESRQAKELIESQLPQLKAGLAEQGVHIEEFTIIINGEENQNSSLAFNQERDGQAGQSQDADSKGSRPQSSIQTAENTVDASRSRSSGLNIYA